MKVIDVFHLDDCQEDAYIFDSVLISDELYQFNLVQFETLTTLEQATECQGLPDVFVIDLNLPESQGLATLERVKAFSQGRPVIVITGYNQDYLGEQAITQGAADFLPKLDSRSQVVKRSIVHALQRNALE